MSTVIFYGDTMWADTCVTYKFNSRREQTIGRKLARHGNSIFGFTGSLAGAAHFMHWVKNGRKPRLWYWLFNPAIVNTVDVLEWDGRVLTSWKSVLKWKAFGLGYWKKNSHLYTR
jgi:hypothetical protein